MSIVLVTPVSACTPLRLPLFRSTVRIGRRPRSTRAPAARPVGLLAVLLAAAAAGCEAPERSAPAAARPAGAAEDVRPASEGVVLFVGTSLTAGYGVGEEDAYPAAIEEKIEAAGLRYRVVNAGVSGETSAGALRRLDWLLRQPFDVLVLETGANDMLRGQDPDSTRENIRAIVRQARAANPEASIVLAGMRSLPNLGREYTRRFESIYPELAAEEDLVLIPFLLEDVAAEPRMNLPDGIHPNEQGQRRVARNVWDVLEPVLRERAGP
jgi:acyl-CoA thioesterase I